MSSRQKLALMIWWCEGTKLRKDKRWKNSYVYSVEVINSNPKIVRIFRDFLVNDLKVPIEKLRGQIQIHKGDDQRQIEKYWSENVGIPKSQFNKTIIREKGNKVGKNEGTFKLRTYNKLLYIELRNLLDKELSLSGYGSAG